MIGTSDARVRFRWWQRTNRAYDITALCARAADREAWRLRAITPTSAARRLVRCKYCLQVLRRGQYVSPPVAMLGQQGGRRGDAKIHGLGMLELAPRQRHRNR